MKRLKKCAAILLVFMMVLSVTLPSSLTIHADETVDVESVECEPSESQDIDANMLTVDESNSDYLEVNCSGVINTTEDPLQNAAGEDGMEKSELPFADFLRLVQDMPSVEEIKQMNEEEINIVVEQYYALLDKYDGLTVEEQERFSAEYPELESFVFGDLGLAFEEAFGSGIEVMSLLPIEEKEAYLILKDYSSEDLKKVPVKTILDKLVDKDGRHIDISDDQVLVLNRIKSYEDSAIQDEHQILDRNQTVDLSAAENVLDYTMELIVGSGNQLDDSSIRYIVRVYVSRRYKEGFDMSFFYYDDEGNVIDLPFEKNSMIQGDSPITDINGNAIPSWNYVYSMDFSTATSILNRDIYLKGSSEADKRPDVSVEIVYTENKADGTKDFFDNGSKMYVDDDGINRFASFIVVYYFDGIQYDALVLNCLVTCGASGITSSVYAKENGALQNVEKRRNSSLSFTESNNTTEEIVLKKEYLSSEQFYLGMDAEVSTQSINYTLQVVNGSLQIIGESISEEITNVNSEVTKAVEGYFTSLEDASGETDLKNILFGDGIEDKSWDLSGEGKQFTIFFESGSMASVSQVFHVTIKVIDEADTYQSYNDLPVIGEADPWFRISGANDTSGNVLNTYVIENGKRNNIDTMYGYGYQAVFINDSVDEFVPRFWKVNDEAISLDNIYVNGKNYSEGDALKFEAGCNELDAVFSVIITDKNGSHTKNYKVKFIKKAKGPKLYVAGPLDPEVRSIFLDEYHENKHDIFIANVGDEALTNLWLDLDATNVQLDSYWTIGGEGNNTLAACPDDFVKEVMSSEYGEMANVAKIRLLPPVSGKGGEISGALKIYSGTEGDVNNSILLATIRLSDLAQNPEITTKELDDAVLYVPYSYLVTTNNMYDWVNVSYEIKDGSLPEGVELIPSTGEIYGVPLETGTFNVTISTHFNSTSENYAFTPSSVELTLTVQDNTNENVYNATDIDDGYQILDAIGVDEGDHDYVLYEIEDTVYRSNGEFGEFVDLWLNGEKLIRDVDYEAESGSTKITIYSQTIDQKANQTGENTIAAEFRTTDTNSLNNTNNTNQLNRTSQNFRISTSCSHTYNAGVITQSANCTSNGVRTYTCTKCGNTRSESISATGHSYDSGVVTKEATKTSTGIRTFTCQKCGTKRTEVIPVKNSSENNNNGNGGSNGGTNQNSNADNQNNNSSVNGNNNSNKPNNNNTGAGNGSDVNNTAVNDLQNVVTTGTATIQVVDRDGMPVSGKTLELHSTPQTAELGADGTAIFDPIEFGEHTLYLKNSKGKTLAEKHISVVEGNSFSVNGDTVTAIRGENFTLKVCFDEDGSMTLKSVQRTSGPDTGDSTNVVFLWIMVFVSAMALIVLEVMRRKNIHK